MKSTTSKNRGFGSMSEGYSRKGGLNTGPSKVAVRPAAPSSMSPKLSRDSKTGQFNTGYSWRVDPKKK